LDVNIRDINVFYSVLAMRICIFFFMYSINLNEFFNAKQ